MPILGALERLLQDKAPDIVAKGLSATPWFHGRNASKSALELRDGPLWLGSPDLANMFTGGGRRAGIEKARKGGVLYPFLAKGEPIQMGDDVLSGAYTNTPDSITELLKRMGLDPQDFFHNVEASAKTMALADYAKYAPDTQASIEPMWDALGTVGAKSNAPGTISSIAGPRPLAPYQLFDRVPVQQEITRQMGPDVSYVFSHPANPLNVTPRGVPSLSGTTLPAEPALWAPNSKGALVSPFELKKGGTVKMADGGSVDLAKPSWLPNEVANATDEEMDNPGLLSSLNLLMSPLEATGRMAGDAAFEGTQNWPTWANAGAATLANLAGSGLLGNPVKIGAKGVALGAKGVAGLEAPVGHRITQMYGPSNSVSRSPKVRGMLKAFVDTGHEGVPYTDVPAYPWLQD